MRKIFAVIAAVFIFAAIVHADTLLDSFSGGDGSPGGNWNNGYGSSSRECTVSSGKIQPSSTGTSCVMTWAPNTYSGDQTAIATISALNAFSDGAIVSVLLRASTPNTRTYYRCAAVNPVPAGDSTFVWKVESGTTTATLNSNSTETWVATDVIECTITGTDPVTITVYRNGVSVLTATDSGAGILSGNLIGMNLYAFDNTTDTQADDFTTADAAPPPPTASNIMVIMVE